MAEQLAIVWPLADRQKFFEFRNLYKHRKAIDTFDTWHSRFVQTLKHAFDREVKPEQAVWKRRSAWACGSGRWTKVISSIQPLAGQNFDALAFVRKHVERFWKEQAWKIGGPAEKVTTFTVPSSVDYKPVGEPFTFTLLGSGQNAKIQYNQPGNMVMLKDVATLLEPEHDTKMTMAELADYIHRLAREMPQHPEKRNLYGELPYYPISVATSKEWGATIWDNGDVNRYFEIYLVC